MFYLKYFKPLSGISEGGLWRNLANLSHFIFALELLFWYSALLGQHFVGF